MSPDSTGQRYYFDVFGTTMRAERAAGQWLLYRVADDGKFSRVRDVVIPADVKPQKLTTFLDDMFHEFASASHPAVKPLQREQD